MLAGIGAGIAKLSPSPINDIKRIIKNCFTNFNIFHQTKLKSQFISISLQNQLSIGGFTDFFRKFIKKLSIFDF